MQKKIISPSKLLNPDGTLVQQGWARDLILEYNREDIHRFKNNFLNKLRIKEWDYYAILSPKAVLALTISDIGYLGMMSVSWIDLEKKTQTTENEVVPFPMGKINLPRSSHEGSVSFNGKKLRISFERISGERILKVDFPSFLNGKGIKAEIGLYQQKDMDSIVMITPFKEDRRCFYYNQKINCMPAKGWVKVGDRHEGLTGDNCFGVLDWGRGVWPWQNTWYWGSASGVIDKHSFGFNIGYGFGDTSAASENALFYDGKIHKLDQVTFHFDGTDFLKPWRFSSNDGRFELDFLPILDRNAKINMGVLATEQHQVFGLFTGNVILDSGEKIYLDKFLGFAEKVYNRW
ncbi:MAG: DUF2804 domain-containing protein [Thermodesulfobacteriota bacterium]|nr:DUF2804 domain-containing protein [Thermodesulfobacteriota bacterium]